MCDHKDKGWYTISTEPDVTRCIGCQQPIPAPPSKEQTPLRPALRVVK